MQPTSCATLLLLCGLLFYNRAQAVDCDPDEVSMAIMSCQQERETLSDVSQLNNYTQLCHALQKYSDCMDPKISNCQGEALVAFRVIKQKYSAKPYNCKVTGDTNDINNIHGAGEHTEDYLESDYEELPAHEVHSQREVLPSDDNGDGVSIVTSTQPQEFAEVTVAELQNELVDNQPPEQNLNQTDSTEADVNSATFHTYIEIIYITAVTVSLVSHAMIL